VYWVIVNTVKPLNKRLLRLFLPYTKTDKIQIQFVTHLPEAFAVPQTPFEVPAKFSRLGLSEIINHLLRLEHTVPFDFLINGEFLRSSLHAWRQHQGTEQTVTVVEYVKALVAPTDHKDAIHKDWIKGLSSANGHVMTASMDGSLTYFASSDLVTPVTVIPKTHGLREPWAVSILATDNNTLRVLSGGKV
jgi:hypothetical protein